MSPIQHLTRYIRAFRAKRKLNKATNRPKRSLQRFIKKYPEFTIGKHCYGLPNVKYQNNNATLNIGSYCSIGNHVTIYLGGNHRTDWVSTYPFPAFFNQVRNIDNFEISNGDINIGSDVWICENVTILSGITIGHGAVIANGAIVTKDVAPYSIVGGSPAKHIKWRFDEDTRNNLLEIAWWNWDDERISKLMHLICSDDIETFINYAKNR